MGTAVTVASRDSTPPPRSPPAIASQEGAFIPLDPQHKVGRGKLLPGGGGLTCKSPWASGDAGGCQTLQDPSRHDLPPTLEA